MGKFEENFSLKKLNTFGINAKAKFFTEFDSVLELKDIINSNIYKNNKTFILGGGSNVLLTQDYDGLVIQHRIIGTCILEDNDNNIIVEVGGGVNWHEFVMWSVRQELSGVENLALIPGTVGASPIQNIGAYGMEVKEIIYKVTALEIATQEIKTFSNEDCNFEYRNSIFKEELKNKFIITKVEFKLSKTPLNKTTYGAIKEELKTLNLEANPKNIADAVINIRNRKLPNPSKIGNCGSFFKNPIISTERFEELQREFPNIVGYKMGDTETKVAAGWLIDNAGLKGYRKGDAGVHRNQALVLVNYNNASGQDIINLSELVQEVILEKYAISIEAEVNFI